MSTLRAGAFAMRVLLKVNVRGARGRRDASTGRNASQTSRALMRSVVLSSKPALSMAPASKLLALAEPSGKLGGLTQPTRAQTQPNSL